MRAIGSTIFHLIFLHTGKRYKTIVSFPKDPRMRQIVLFSARIELSHGYISLFFSSRKPRKPTLIWWTLPSFFEFLTMSNWNIISSARNQSQAREPPGLHPLSWLLVPLICVLRQHLKLSIAFCSISCILNWALRKRHQFGYSLLISLTKLTRFFEALNSKIK